MVKFISFFLFFSTLLTALHNPLWGSPDGKAIPPISPPPQIGLENFHPKSPAQLLRKMDSISSSLYTLQCDLIFFMGGRLVKLKMVIKSPDFFSFKSENGLISMTFDGEKFIFLNKISKFSFLVDLSGNVEKILLSTFLFYFKPGSQGVEGTLKAFEKFYHPKLLPPTGDDFVMKFTPTLTLFPFSLLPEAIKDHVIDVYINKKTGFLSKMIQLNGKGEEINRLVMEKTLINSPVPQSTFQQTIPPDFEIQTFGRLFGNSLKQKFGDGFSHLSQKTEQSLEKIKNFITSPFQSNPPQTEPINPGKPGEK